jgi:hypothetical protein
MISPISLTSLAPKVQAVRPVTRKLLPDEEDQPKKGERRAAPKKARQLREPISALSASAEARSSSAVQAALTGLKLGG